MSDSTFVWAIDTMTGAAGPVSRAVVEAFTGRYRVDEKHPTHDTLGQLLPAKAAVSNRPVRVTLSADVSGFQAGLAKAARKPATKPPARKPATRTKPAPTADPTPEEA